MAKAYNENSGGNLTFYNMYDGKIVERVEEGTEGAVERKLTKGPKEGQSIWEVYNNAIGGMITGGGIVVKDILGKKIPEIELFLDDDAKIGIPMYLLKDVAEVLPKLDRTEPIKIRSYKSKSGRIGLEISQGGKKLESHFTVWDEGDDGKKRPRNINGLPKPEYDEIDGWDFRDHDKFLKAVAIDFFAQYASNQATPSLADLVPEPDIDEEIPF